MLRIPVTIDDKPAQAVCDDKGWLTLSNGSPNVGVTFDSFAQDIDEILKNHGLEGTTNSWCTDTPLFQVQASTWEDVKCLLKLQGKIQKEMASKVAARLEQYLPVSDPPPRPFVKVSPEVYVMIPDYRRMDGKLIPVEEETITSCKDICRENGFLDIGARFMALQKNPTMEDRGITPSYVYSETAMQAFTIHYTVTGPANILQLENDLKEVVDWFHLGLAIGVPDYKLTSIGMARSHFPEQCRSEVFQYYLQTVTDRKWLTIIQALVSIGHGTLAIKIALKYGKSKAVHVV